MNKIHVTLGPSQLEKLKKVLMTKQPLSFKLSHADLVNGNIPILLSKRNSDKIIKALALKKGVVIKFTKDEMKMNQQLGGGIFDIIKNVASKYLLPAVKEVGVNMLLKGGLDLAKNAFSNLSQPAKAEAPKPADDEDDEPAVDTTKTDKAKTLTKAEKLKELKKKIDATKGSGLKDSKKYGLKGGLMYTPNMSASGTKGGLLYQPNMANTGGLLYQPNMAMNGGLLYPPNTAMSTGMQSKLKNMTPAQLQMLLNLK